MGDDYGNNGVNNGGDDNYAGKCTWELIGLPERNECSPKGKRQGCAVDEATCLETFLADRIISMLRGFAAFFCGYRRYGKDLR